MPDEMRRPKLITDENEFMRDTEASALLQKLASFSSAGQVENEMTDD